MLKLKLTKDEHAKLSPELQKEYKGVEGKEGEFVLDTDVQYEDVKPLKNALEQEKKHRKEATEKVAKLEEEKKDLEARSGEATALEKSWQTKLEKKEKEWQEQNGRYKAELERVYVDNVAQQIASEISTAPELILPHVKTRLRAEEADGKFLTRVLDSEGKVSASSVNELKQEIVADKRFAPIITASKASGGGASGGKGAPAGGKAFKDMTEAEKTQLYRNDRATFDREYAAYQQTNGATP